MKNQELTIKPKARKTGQPHPVVVRFAEHRRLHDARIRNAKNKLLALIINAKEEEIITIPDDICKEVRIWWKWEKSKSQNANLKI